MKTVILICTLASSLLVLVPASGAPRDAAAVLNRCGAPFKGDETIYENTVSGGRRLLNYQRGTLIFDRVANDGWTFASGEHRGVSHLSADQMQAFLPCLKEALADAAAPKPLPVLTGADRFGITSGDTATKLVAGSVVTIFGGLGLFLWLGKRFRGSESLLAE